MIEVINVIVASLVAFAIGAAWYLTLSKPWLEAAGLDADGHGKPTRGQSAGLFVFTFVMQILVAGMMRHVFGLRGIDTVGEGLVAGLGIGLFFVTPWIAINNVYGMRPLKLTLIDSGYATLACAAMGLVLTLF